MIKLAFNFRCFELVLHLIDDQLRLRAMLFGLRGGEARYQSRVITRREQNKHYNKYPNNDKHL